MKDTNDEGFEIGKNYIMLGVEKILIKSRRMPLARDGEPTYLTQVWGDSRFGLQEFPTGSFEACSAQHRCIVERYALQADALADGAARVLVDGVL